MPSGTYVYMSVSTIDLALGTMVQKALAGEFSLSPKRRLRIDTGREDLPSSLEASSVPVSHGHYAEFISSIVWIATVKLSNLFEIAYTV